MHRVNPSAHWSRPHWNRPFPWQTLNQIDWEGPDHPVEVNWECQFKLIEVFIFWSGDSLTPWFRPSIICVIPNMWIFFCVLVCILTTWVFGPKCCCLCNHLACQGHSIHLNYITCAKKWSHSHCDLCHSAWHVSLPYRDIHLCHTKHH